MFPIMNQNPNSLVKCRAVMAQEPHETVTGFLIPKDIEDIPCAVALLTNKYTRPAPVKAESIRYLTGFADETGKPLCAGDDVTLCGIPGQVVFELGAFGIGFQDGYYVPWQDIWQKVQEINILNSHLRTCMNDNFISFWELAGNMDLDIYCENIPVPGLKLIQAEQTEQTRQD